MEKEIPKGDYCYKIIDIRKKENDHKFKTQVCPFLKQNKYYKENSSNELECHKYFCSFVNDYDIFLDDLVKICNTNIGDEDYEQKKLR